MIRITSLLWALIAFTMISQTAYAQNTGGIFGPVVNDNHRSIQYRSSTDPDNASGDVGFAQRLHYQQSINGDFMWRLVGQLRKTDASDLDFDFVQAELFWQITPDDNKLYQTGLRFDARIRDQDRPNQVGVNWSNQWDFGEGWQIRALGLSVLQVGNNSSDGIFLQGRGHLAKSIGGGKSIGIETFNNLGNTSDGNFLEDQSHAVGPFITAPIGHDFSIFAGALFGVSDAAADTELRLWLTKKL